MKLEHTIGSEDSSLQSSQSHTHSPWPLLLCSSRFDANVPLNRRKEALCFAKSLTYTAGSHSKTTYAPIDLVLGMDVMHVRMSSVAAVPKSTVYSTLAN